MFPFLTRYFHLEVSRLDQTLDLTAASCFPAVESRYIVILPKYLPIPMPISCRLAASSVSDDYIPLAPSKEGQLLSLPCKHVFVCTPSSAFDSVEIIKDSD